MKKLKLTYQLKIEDEETGDVLLDNSIEYRANSFPAIYNALTSLNSTISHGSGVTKFNPEIADKVDQKIEQRRDQKP